MRRVRINCLLLFVFLILLACPVHAKNGAKHAVGKSSDAEKIKRREARDARKMAGKRRRKELRRQERKLRINERIKEQKKEKKKEKANKIKPLNAKGLKAAKSKLEGMRKRSAATSNGILSLNSREYKKFINDGPRGYYTLVVYTALDDEFECHICQSMNKEMVKLARAVNLTELDPPIFVVSIDYANNAEVFRELQFRHVPIAILVPPTNSTKKLPIPTFYKRLPQQFRLSSVGRLSAEDFANFIQRNTPVEDLSIPQSGPKVYRYVGLLLVTVIALYLSITGLVFGDITKFRDFKLPYLALVLVFYAWCAGAGMYNIIKSTPWHGGSERDPEYFYPQNGSQYIYGSMIVGALNVAIGIVVVILNSWALSDKSEKPPQGILHSTWKLIFSLICNPWVVMAVAVYIWWQLLGIYTMKNRMYNYGAIPEHELFDSEAFYKKSLKTFKQTIIGKRMFRYYRKGSRIFWRYYRRYLEDHVLELWSGLSAFALSKYRSTRPWVMGKLSDLQETVDKHILGVKDEL